ncbi:MAG: imidazole glycerol phosphate synthase subunit HisH [Bacteroidetes bacterium]|nr:imidazole glycerol phosphate synthase subunit HisH [Bacteroidota bacterium]
MIGILDYGMGNLSSVRNALSFLQIENVILSSPDQIAGVSHMIIPGVGAFGAAMENIARAGFIDPIATFANSGKPLLGICLGMQLLATEGTEPAICRGLDLIKGRVELLPSKNLSLPHMGWNGINLQSEHTILEGVKMSADFYFVHSFVFMPAYKSNVVTTTEYGTDFTSIITNERRNVIGIQFHPEKSQKQGLKILDNFSKMSNA